MKRRSFVKSTALMAAAGAVAPKMNMAKENPPKTGREFYELRVYTLKDFDRQRQVQDYFQDALIPALVRLGSGPVGVFTELKPTGQSKVYALIPYSSLDNFLTVQDKLAADQLY